MSYKKILFGFGILNSILLFFITYSFLHYQENIKEGSAPSLSQNYVSVLTSDKSPINHPNNFLSLEFNSDRIHNFIFLLASSLSLIPFLLFVTIVAKKFKKYKKKQKELIHANKKKDLFFSIISHDLKSPAQNLISLSELNCKNPGIEEALKINQLIHTCSLKHYDLLNNLLDWSKTQFTENHFIKASCNLKQLIEENICRQADRAKEKNLTISNLIPDTIYLSTNENMLSTVIRNLLNNAIKFSSTDGKIAFYCKQHKKHIQLHIEDNGLGMSSETLKNLFNLCYIRSLRGTHKEVGTGIGLIICKEILDKLKGGIKVISSENNGTIFILHLPLK